MKKLLLFLTIGWATAAALSAASTPLVEMTKRYVALFEPRLTESVEHADQALRSGSLVSPNRSKALRHAKRKLEALTRLATIAKALLDRIERHIADPQKKPERGAYRDLHQFLAQVESSITECHSLLSTAAFPFDSEKEEEIRLEIMAECKELKSREIAASNQSLQRTATNRRL